MTQNIVIAHGGDLSYPSGGSDRVTAFASGLTERGFDVTVVSVSPEYSLPDRLSAVEKAFVSAPNSGVLDQPIRGVRVTRKAKRIAQRQNAVIQFEHSTLGGAAQLMGHRDYVLDVHDLAHSSPLYGDLPLGSVVQSAIHNIEERAIRSAAKVIVVSEKMRTLIRERWDIDAEKVHVIPNGYFGENVSPLESTEVNERQVVFFGTLHPKLDTESLFAIAGLPEVSELVVVGDGPKRGELEAEKEKRECRNLYIEGQMTDREAFELVAKSSLAINPQRPSSLQRVSSPVKIYNYAALGVPMVLSNGPEIAHRLSNSDAAVVVQSSESFPDAVQDLLQDEQRRNEMARTAKRVVANCSWSHRLEKLAELYEQWPS